MSDGTITVGVAGEEFEDGTRLLTRVFVRMPGAPDVFLRPTKAREMSRNMRLQLETAAEGIRSELLDVVAEIERCANEVETATRPAQGRA